VFPFKLVKVNVKLSPYFFNWAPCHDRVLGEWRYSSTHSLTSVLDGGEWSASRLVHFTPRKRTPGTHWIGDWVGPSTIQDAVMKSKIPSPRRESNPRTTIVQPVTSRYTDLAITAHFQTCLPITIQSPSALATGIRCSTLLLISRDVTYDMYSVKRGMPVLCNATVPLGYR
jgi:hypothetical protein